MYSELEDRLKEAQEEALDDQDSKLNSGMISLEIASQENFRSSFHMIPILSDDWFQDHFETEDTATKLHWIIKISCKKPIYVSSEVIDKKKHGTVDIRSILNFRIITTFWITYLQN